MLVAATAFSELHRSSAGSTVLFGSGWGNLQVPLAHDDHSNAGR